MDTKMAAATLPLASNVKQFSVKSPVGSAGKSLYFGSAKSSGYSAVNEYYYLNVGKVPQPLPTKLR